jgi:phosphoglycolate phosphatase-like HAD superfamily hydrolase
MERLPSFVAGAARRLACVVAVVLLASAPLAARAAPDPLPSWNEGPAKQAIVAFVARTTTPSSPDLLAPADRIAVFDNDGTLWAEQPIYNQFVFVLDRAATMARRDPTLLQKPAFAAAAGGDPAAIAKLTDKDLIELAAAAQAGLTPEAYDKIVKAWLASARQSRFGRAYTALVYQPQLELMAYLRAAGFRTYIVSGGEVQFMRAFAQSVYGVPPEQVIGTSFKAGFALKDGNAAMTFLPQLGSLDDGAEKPANILLHIGRAPAIAVGNSDGDQQMLEYSAAAARPNLEILVHHDDADREYAYDRASKIGKLDKALDEAAQRGWLVVSMLRDWRTIFPAP